MTRARTYKFYGTEFKASTAWGATKTITGATNANPCVITAVAHGITDSAPAKFLSVGGMTELNGHVYIAERVTDDTVRLLGVDATGFGVFTSGGTLQQATMTATCQETGYSFDSGSTPVTEDETNCGVAVSLGAPRLGSVSLNFKQADDTLQLALEASRAAGSEMAFRVEVDGMPYVRYDVGYVTQLTEAGSAGATWDGTASVTLTQARVKVAA